MIDDKQLAEWRAKTEAATPGPWEWSEEDLCALRAPNAYVPRTIIRLDADWCRVTAASDTEFIATARTAMPQLLDEVAWLRAAHADDLAIIADYRSGRIRTCPEHGISIAFDDPVERENERLRAEVEALRWAIDDSGVLCQRHEDLKRKLFAAVDRKLGKEVP